MSAGSLVQLAPIVLGYFNLGYTPPVPSSTASANDNKLHTGAVVRMGKDINGACGDRTNQTD